MSPNSCTEGDAVRILSGHFANTIVTIYKCIRDEHKVVVIIPIFGKQIPTTLDYEQIEKIAPQSLLDTIHYLECLKSGNGHPDAITYDTYGLVETDENERLTRALKMVVSAAWPRRNQRAERALLDALIELTQLRKENEALRTQLAKLSG
jgi:hypothetical protein